MTTRTANRLAMTVDEITPQVAERYLRSMRFNRKLRRATVERYAAEMARGSWNGLTGEAVKFDTDGKLVDGQHRLRAIIAAETPVQLAVIRGVAADAQDYMDTGIVRTAADVLTFHSVSNAVTVAAIARKVLVYQEGGVSAMSNAAAQPSNAEILEFADGNEALQAAARYADGEVMRGLVAKTVSGVLHYITHEVDSEMAETFAERLGEGVGLSKTDPEWRLRNLFIANRSRRRAKLSAKYLIGFGIMAWNARREGREIKLFKLPRRGEDWPAAN